MAINTLGRFGVVEWYEMEYMIVVREINSALKWLSDAAGSGSNPFPVTPIHTKESLLMSGTEYFTQ